MGYIARMMRAMVFSDSAIEIIKLMFIDGETTILIFEGVKMKII